MIATSLRQDWLDIAEIAEEEERLREATKDIHTAFTSAEIRALFRLAVWGPGTGCIVEIGSFLGYSTIWLAHGGQARGTRVYAVDHHKGDKFTGHTNTYEAFMANVDKYVSSNLLKPLVMTSIDAAAWWEKSLRQPIRLLLIDAYHEYEALKSDWNAWKVNLERNNHVVCFHDYAPTATRSAFPDVQRFVDQCPGLLCLAVVEGLWIGKRRLG